jgi:hypothetical protein
MAVALAGNARAFLPQKVAGSVETIARPPTRAATIVAALSRSLAIRDDFQWFRNQQVIGSSPIAGSIFLRQFATFYRSTPPIFHFDPLSEPLNQDTHQFALPLLRPHGILQLKIDKGAFRGCQ